MERIGSYVEGRWWREGGEVVPLLDPATEEVIAEAYTDAISAEDALVWARTRGGPSLRSHTFAERGAMLRALADVIRTHREALLDAAMRNGGATRGDAKFDVDGAWAVLAHYARLGEALGSARWLADGDVERLGRNPRLGGMHLWAPLEGVALAIDAYNFPAWGFAEKAATAWLAGMPVVVKPATETALVTALLVERFLDAGALPEGALQLVVGGGSALVDAAQPGDVIAFTGSSHTATAIRRSDAVAARGVRLNVEADSVNAMVLGADVEPDSEAWDLFVADVVREMTQKAGQKCTAVRRIVAPPDRADALAEAIASGLDDVVLGNPQAEGVRMGPLVSRAQLERVRSGVDALGAHAEGVPRARQDAPPVGVPDGKGFFFPATLLRARGDVWAPALHTTEVFGPVATLLPLAPEPAALGELARLAGGGLVFSLYSADLDLCAAAVEAVAPWHGRVYLGHPKLAGIAPGPGAVPNQLVHGGPGRAGGGEELGGLRGLTHYMQRAGVQGLRPFLERIRAQLSSPATE